MDQSQAIPSPAGGAGTGAPPTPFKRRERVPVFTPSLKTVDFEKVCAIFASNCAPPCYPPEEDTQPDAGVTPAVQARLETVQSSGSHWFVRLQAIKVSMSER
ncbi:hypothetical protein KIPB_014071 [Kipferlia bialata]|uniref:Uncharacterized protein n=1 Tax=Kipferlia bialata TaxID=797122 RepID=A0A391NTB6_9EUKA|nr:hypothetical protein KIPB_014071 [Kipferlia bialata]|eukprot:g14071.t1